MTSILYNKSTCLADTLRMMYFNITEETANVQDITERVREDFEDNSLVLVQANGLRVEDSVVTRGK